MFHLGSDGWDLEDVTTKELLNKKEDGVEKIDYKTAINFLLPRHYSGRKPKITHAFGWYFDNNLVAVCTFGKPASNSVCKSVCGEAYRGYVYELNRLCRVEGLKHNLSQFVGACLRVLKLEDWIILSYSDTAMNHHGYIYQACNFIYTGKTKQHIDRVNSGRRHPRHVKQSTPYRTLRSEKHRYVYFCTKNKKLKKEWIKNFKYPIESYPKGDNKNYTLGEYLKPVVFEVKQ